MTTDQPNNSGEDRSTLMPTSRSTDWYAEGQSRVVEAGGLKVTVHYVGRKGRRARIVIEAPAGAEFRSDDATRHGAPLIRER